MVRRKLQFDCDVQRMEQDGTRCRAFEIQFKIFMMLVYLTEETEGKTVAEIAETLTIN